MLSCDFCAWGDPIWKYPCKDFESDKISIPEAQTNVSLNSFKEWLACFECSDLIEEENLNELARRSYRSAVDPAIESRIPPTRRANLLRWVQNTHLAFMRNRTGPRQPFQQPEGVD